MILTELLADPAFPRALVLGALGLACHAPARAPAASTPQPEGRGVLYLASPRRVCASTARIGDTLTLVAVGRLRDGTELPAGTRVQVAITDAHVSRSPADPIRLSFALRALILPSGEQRPVTGDVIVARVERARAAGGAFDGCVPEGGQLTVRLADADR